MNRPDRSVSVWLLTCCGMIFIMALIGAVTRLTESGLSITDWNPIMGALPPMNDGEWQQAFAAYQQIPQYQILHRGMDLAAFKGIYFWEWLHRLWGRLIGLVFLLPFLYFLARRRISRDAGIKFAAIFALGAVQGFIGWYMVQSGLITRTSVSPYRLALHLCFALAIYSILFWLALAGVASESMRRGNGRNSILMHGWFALIVLAITMCWGAFVAGLHAGEAYNTWPLMDGEFFPSAGATILPVWHNAFENLALAQFIHRWLGPTTMFVLLAWVARCWKVAANKSALTALSVMAVFQVLLGISTLMSHAQIALAVTHQAGAITLLSLLLWNLKIFSSATRSDK